MGDPEDVDQVLDGAGAAAGDDGDGDGLGDEAGDVELVALADAVGVDGVEADLAGATVNGLFGPGEGVAAGGGATAVDDDLVATGDGGSDGDALGIHAEDDALAAEGFGALGEDVGGLDGEGVEGDLVGAGEEGGAHILNAADAAADGEGDAEGASGAGYHVKVAGTALGGGGDVVEDDFVGAVGAVAGGHLNGVADVDVALEADAFGDAAIADVQTDDEAFQEHQRASQVRKLRRSAAPASPLRSGWNCVAKSEPWVRAEAKRSPQCSVRPATSASAAGRTKKEWTK